jgi:hypothetical protein
MGVEGFVAQLQNYFLLLLCFISVHTIIQGRLKDIAKADGKSYQLILT